MVKLMLYNTKKNVAGKIIHYVEVKEGSFNASEEVNLIVDKTKKKLYS